MIPNILSVAGSDPSGGAGIQADIKAISAIGGYAMAAITALTVQNTLGVKHVEFVDPDVVAAQITVVLDDIHVDAVKIGMIGTALTAEAVAAALSGFSGWVVVDPVMVAKGGDRLLAPAAVSALRQHLLPLCSVLTPNLPEAADLLECSEARDRSEMENQARALNNLGPKWVLLKGGHLQSDDCPDLLVGKGGEKYWVTSPRTQTRNTHGTGCTLSSALATQLALTRDIYEATKAAKDYITKAITAADALSVGHGHGPIDHFPMFRRKT